MIKVTNLQEVNHIENADLRMHILEKAKTMMQEYQVENLDDIGCFIVLELEEFTEFPISEMEFVEMLSLKENVFLHGVRIVGRWFPPIPMRRGRQRLTTDRNFSR